MFDRGISYEGDLVDLASLGNIVEKTGAWYNYKSTRLGQGRENAKQYLRDNPAIAEELTARVMSSRGAGLAPLNGDGRGDADDLDDE